MVWVETGIHSLSDCLFVVWVEGWHPALTDSPLPLAYTLIERPGGGGYTEPSLGQATGCSSTCMRVPGKEAGINFHVTVSIKVWAP